MRTSKKENIRVAVAGIYQSARRKAFRRNLPIAVSEGGQTILIYPDGTRKPFTPEAIAALKHAR